MGRIAQVSLSSEILKNTSVFRFEVLLSLQRQKDDSNSVAENQVSFLAMRNVPKGIVHLLVPTKPTVSPSLPMSVEEAER